MNARTFLTFAAAWLVAVPAVFAAQAPKLDQLLAEYHKARTEVLSKLNPKYAQQADVLAKQYKQAKDTVRAKRAADFAARLLDSDESNDLQGIKAGDPGPDPLAILQSDYAQARDENLRVVDTFYITTAQNLETQLVKENNAAGAKVLATFLEKIKGSNNGPAAKTQH